MMGSHPGGRVTACSVGCSILEYLMEMMVIFIYPLGSTRDLTLGWEGKSLASLELYPIGALVFFGCWSKAIGSILRTSDQQSRNIDRVISGHLRSGVSHTGSPWLSVCIRVCPSAHTGCPWLSISTHISTLVLGLSTLVLGLSMLALPVDCSGDFGPRGLSVQYTQDVRGCPSANTGRPCLSVCTHKTSVAVRVCLCVSVSTHRTSVVVHQYTNHHVGPWTQHADPSCNTPKPS
ncbi:hypothetical protein YC2023_065995 [Brassica napus]